MPHDPAVASVEKLLGASRRYEPAAAQGRVVATRALWVCNCYSDNDRAPRWLVHEVVAGHPLAWTRVPDGVDPFDLVEAKDAAGDHTSPAVVLQWLRREVADPWVVEVGGGDALLLDAIRDLILAE